MRATIWHNPRCSKSRAALALLQSRAAVDLVVREYLKQPPDRDELVDLLGRAGLAPADLLRGNEPVARERGLARASAETILTALVEEPGLIERPVVITGRGAVIARPAERLLSIL